MNLKSHSSLAGQPVSASICVNIIRLSPEGNPVIIVWEVVFVLQFLRVKKEKEKL